MPDEHTPVTGIFISEDKLRLVYENNPDLHNYSIDDLCGGLHSLDFMGDPRLRDYIVTEASPFYSYLKQAGWRDVVIL